MNGNWSLESLYSRRELLRRSGAGFGLVALAGTLARAGGLAGAGGSPGLRTHFPPRARRVIFLFMNGGPSHVDTFDPKPALKTHEGQEPEDGRNRKKSGGFLPSPFAFRAHGAGGVVLSELFPRLAARADDLCVVRSMHTDVPNHEPGLLLMNSGNQQPVRPSLGSWVSYGLGAENEGLPGYVVLCPGLPVVGPRLWSAGFLPGEHQGTSLDTNDLAVEKLLPYLRRADVTRAEQRRQLDLIGALNRLHLETRSEDSALEAQVRALETAFRMQVEASDAFDVSREPRSLRELYGASVFGQSCLLARRLVERGVRFVQVYYVSKKDKQPWDTHTDNNSRHEQLCADADQATAALLGDLKARGLLDDTLVVWGGEFGRTPYAEKNEKNSQKPGRDHHHTGFSMLLAGGGVRGGLTYGATDELGMHAVEDRVHVHDLHATLLHLLGIDHERLTYRYSGRDFRLTDVHGRVVHDIIF
jgi:hypothetical protein